MRGVLTAALLCSAILLSAQNEPLKKPVDNLATWNLLKYAKYTWQSVKHSVSRPAYWKGKNFNTLGFLIAGTIALSSVDEPANRFFKRQDAKAPKLVKDFGWYLGSSQNYFMVNAGLYGVGLLTKSETVRKTSVLIISSSVTTGLIQSFCKTAIGRARPGKKYGAFKFNPFSPEGAFHSFPSGHTILSMTMAHA